jgi:drug/metabolite transporter (DMT)-like permease
MPVAPHANLVKGWAWIGVTVLCWIPMFSVGKRTMEHIDPFALATLRYAMGLCVLVSLLVASEGWQALRYEGRLISASVMGVIGICGFNLLVWMGLLYTLPEHAAVIAQMQTPLIALVAWFSRGQRPAPFTLGCVALAIVGVLVVVTKGHPLEALANLGGDGALLGDLLVFLGALSWVIYSMAAAALSGWSPLRMTVLTCLPGFVGLLVANTTAIAMGWAHVPTWDAIWSVHWQIAYFAFGSVVVGVLGFNAAARYLGALNTILMLNLVPVGVFAIEAALGRSFAGAELVGAGLVIGALVANNVYLRGARTSR